MSAYDILFEPVQIGPVTAPNRFYQVPHCNGLGHGRPQAEARNRAIKAEGGWGVVCTQEVEIHPSAEVSPYLEGRLWDDRDLPTHRLITEAIHQHGSLAAIELAHMGHHATNRTSRLAPLSVRHMPVDSIDPINARAMSRRDISDLRTWHINAAKRSVEAGYDIVYVYAGHNMSILMHFLQARINNRSDEYGGTVKNRIRLTREILEGVKDAVGNRAAVAFRCAVDELMGEQGIQANDDGAEIVSELAEIPDLWDVNISDWSNDSATARFQPEEGYQLPYTGFVKSLTSKPVVGVGRFTSADRMVSLIKNGELDFIGAARPSIADPFLPEKIRNNRIESIRECIGCNICVASDNIIAPIRCTQNPTSGEEWRKNWHPERSNLSADPQHVLVVGAGPSGLECALQLTRQGHQVTLAEKLLQAGGRSASESQLPGFSSYKRVADYRLGLLTQSPLCDLHLDNNLGAEEILELGIEHVCLATGAIWNRDGFGRNQLQGIDHTTSSIPVLTPDDLLSLDMQQAAPVDTLDSSNISGKNVVVYDDDHYYMGGAVAEMLQAQGCQVTLVTPETMISAWTVNTLEQHKIQSKLTAIGVRIETGKVLTSVKSDSVNFDCVYQGNGLQLKSEGLVLVTSRQPRSPLHNQLQQLLENENRQNSKPVIQTLACIGDGNAPSTIAAAVYEGHHFARNFQNAVEDQESGYPYKDAYTREFIKLESPL